MDIIHTVPKATEPDWDKYLSRAKSFSHHYYQTSRQPTKLETGDSCWLVHDGEVKGFFIVRGVFFSEEPIRNPIKDYKSPPGWYVTKGRRFYPCAPEPMIGFQGWRYRRSTSNTSPATLSA